MEAVLSEKLLDGEKVIHSEIPEHYTETREKISVIVISLFILLLVPAVVFAESYRLKAVFLFSALTLLCYDFLLTYNIRIAKYIRKYFITNKRIIVIDEGLEKNNFCAYMIDNIVSLETEKLTDNIGNVVFGYSTITSDYIRQDIKIRIQNVKNPENFCNIIRNIKASPKI